VIARPVLNDHLESSVPGLFLIGDLAGAPVIKLAMEQGVAVVRHIAAQADARSALPDAFDLAIVGAGAAGMSAALEAQSVGLRAVVLEKNRVGSTVADLPEGKWIYTEPDDRPLAGRLALQAATKEDVVAEWQAQARAESLDVREGESVQQIRRKRDGSFEIVTTGTTYSARRVIIAMGRSGNPRRLGVPGEDLPHVNHRLFNPNLFVDRDIVVVGGGNSAVEAAIALSVRNRVTLSYRGSDLHRITRENARRLQESSVQVLLESRVTRFGPHTCVIDGVSRHCDAAFVLIGSDPPREFLRSIGVRFEDEWLGKPLIAAALVAAALGGLALYAGQNSIALFLPFVSAAALLWLGVRGDRFALLGVAFLIAYTIYGAKHPTGQEFWPFTGWGFQTLSFFDRPWSFWYTVLYTALMTIFGIPAMKRWGFDRKDRFQIWRYASLLGFQWVFFFLIPEVLFRWAVEYQWIGEKLASDPNFASNAWRSYGLVYAWPLFFYTFFGAPHQVWIFWGIVLSFVIIPVLALIHGKRYCSWICGCGGLAETVGDRWRHRAPKGPASIRWERMNAVVLAAAVVITVAVVARDVAAVIQKPADTALAWYRLIADVWLVGIVPISLYPIFGGKIWCRYWCPLAKMMELFSAAFTRIGASRFAIHSNEKCIACGECSHQCQVGIDVMRFALKQETITNLNSSCIGCGICVTVCPMNVLSFAPLRAEAPALVQISKART
jgi:thioredoxin reductase/polyferredoxin